MTEPLIPAIVRAQVRWENPDTLPVLAANQFLVQLSMSEPGGNADVVLTVGYVAPPLLLGSPEEQRAAAEALDHVTVRPVGRFSVPVSKAGELAAVIQDLLQRVGAQEQQL